MLIFSHNEDPDGGISFEFALIAKDRNNKQKYNMLEMFDRTP